MEGFSGLNNEYKFNQKSVWAYSDHDAVEDTPLDYDNIDLPLPLNLPDHKIGNTSFSRTFDADSTEDNEFSGAVLKYITQVLMEDDFDDEACTIQDSTLCVAERSFYEVLNNEHPPSPNQQFHLQDTSSSDASDSYSCSNCSSNISNNLVDGDQLMVTEFLVNEPLESQHSLQFEGGREKSKEVLPSGNFDIDDFVENNRSITPELKKTILERKGMAEKDEGDTPISFSRGRKSLHPDESDFEEGRSNKHLAVYAEDLELHEMFDKLLLFNCEKDESASNSLGGTLENGLAKGSNGGTSVTKKRVIKREAVDMRSLLIQCMESIASNDYRGADKLLKHIRQRSSPLGDASQRLAHCFANAIEARLAGTGSLIYKDLADKNRFTSESFKAYELYISAFPFVKTSNYFTTQKILEVAEKATSLHIIHFGIMHGFQLPPLVQRLATRPGGPPKLRITGIDFPQPGFRPTAMVEKTGLRLANYCEGLNVPFEYSAIAQKWETIHLDDLKIEKDEVLVVYCLYQFHFLLDDTILENSPRDGVLNLIKKINPDIFIHGITNGAYNSPFFVSRFREALFYFSTLFDMFEATVPRENQKRMVYETEMYGKEVFNIVACEGLERVERPETYKQWQVRTLRAGFRQLPLNQEIMKKVKAKVKSSYHKNFFVDEASQWMLQGWNGRVMYALSCWKPA